MCCTGCTGGKGVCGALVTLEVRGMCCTGYTGGKRYVLHWLHWR